jgi:putative transposase
MELSVPHVTIVERPRLRSKRDKRPPVRLTRNGFTVRGSGRMYVAKVGDLRVEWSRPRPSTPSTPSSCTVIRVAEGCRIAPGPAEIENACGAGVRPGLAPAVGDEAGIRLARLA